MGGREVEVIVKIAIDLIFVLVLILTSLTDIRRRLIPDRIVLPGMLAVFVMRLFSHPLPLWNYILAWFIGGGILYLVALASWLFMKREGVGGGDIKLFAFVGLVLGFPGILIAMFVSSSAALIYGLLFRHGRGFLPFGPFIAVAGLGTYIVGDRFVYSMLSLL